MDAPIWRMAASHARTLSGLALGSGGFGLAGPRNVSGHALALPWPAGGEIAKVEDCMLSVMRRRSVLTLRLVCDWA